MLDAARRTRSPEERWDRDAEPGRNASARAATATRTWATRATARAAGKPLRDHLLWQLHLGHFSQRDATIGLAIIDAIDEDGYLRDSLDAIAEVLLPGVRAGHAEIQQVLHRIQQFDPVGVGARDLGECLRLQLLALPARRRARACAGRGRRTAGAPAAYGPDGLCAELDCRREDADAAVQLLRSLDLRPGSRYGELPPAPTSPPTA